MIKVLKKRGEKFQIVIGPKKIGKLRNKNIFFSLSKLHNVFRFPDYVNIYQHIVPMLEENGNKVFPSSKDCIWWENKLFMHRKFDELGTSTPKTTEVLLPELVKEEGIEYPFLIKDPNSAGSAGLYKITQKSDIQDLLKKYDLYQTKILLKQQLIDMRKDLRVIFVGGKIVHYYWRINLKDEWKPTSTSFGSKVDFIFFPEQWRQFLIDSFLKMDMITGAFDVTWDGDNLETTPLILEVSPQYSPNPPFKTPGYNDNYGYHKKKFRFKDSLKGNQRQLMQQIFEEYISVALDSDKKYTRIVRFRFFVILM
jgi:glutathione synthase/RimK-type ligase-like ATP-grasp enzyme